ncbi:unnamed protein product, partial [Rotaria sp. Silwood2]
CAPQSRLSQSHPFVADHHRLRELDVEIFTWEQDIDMFKSKEFQKKFSVDCNIQLISYLYDSKTDKEIAKLLHRIPFIMDRNKCLQIPTKICFPSKFNDISWYSNNTQEAYVHEDLMNKLQNHHIKWLEQLGVTFRTDLSFFHHTIIPQASTFINVENALHTIQRLCYLYVNGQIHSDDLKNLGELSLLTKANTLVPANRLYLSTEYEPSLSIDNYFPKMTHLFVPTSYMQNVFRIKWKHFFVSLGVQENINLIPLNDNGRLVQHYYEDQMKIIFCLNSNQVHRYKYKRTIKFLELTENNFDFARFFWQHAIQNINVRDLTKSEIAYWGQSNKRGAIFGSDVKTFPQWFVLNRPCIPVQILSSNDTYKKECLKSIYVYSNRLSPWIGHYLPTFECTPNGEPLSDEWLKFFKLKTELSTDDYIYILHQIYVRHQTGYDFENDLHIQKIYTNLLNILSNTDTNQRQLYREKCLSKIPIDLFETHVLTLLTTSSIDDYFIQLGIHVANNDSSNDQITKLIERDNLELFNRLPHFSLLCTPDELLIAGLEAQNSIWIGCIYHYTHLENAVSILRDQAIKSRHLFQKTSTQFSNENLGSNKSKKRNNYTPMCPIPIFFRLNLRVILNILDLKWKVSIDDMSSKKTEYDCTIDIIKRFDFCGLFNDLDTNRCKELEFLIENQLDLRLLPNDAITLVFQYCDAKESLESILSTQIYNCEIKRHYFGQNNRIFINHDSEQDHISVMIDGKTERQGEIFIVQIKSNENEKRNNLACKGNIDRIFHYILYSLSNLIICVNTK